MAFGTIVTQSITFFNSRDAAVRMAERNGGEAEGFKVAPATGRDGQYVIRVYDTDEPSFFLGYL